MGITRVLQWVTGTSFGFEEGERLLVDSAGWTSVDGDDAGLGRIAVTNRRLVFIRISKKLGSRLSPQSWRRHEWRAAEIEQIVQLGDDRVALFARDQRVDLRTSKREVGRLLDALAEARLHAP